MSTLDADALATLTPEERDAIEAADASPEEIAAMQRIAGAADENGNDEDTEGDDGAADDDAPPAAAGGADAGAGAAAAGDAAPAAGADAAAPRYEAKLPDDFEQKVAGLAQREAELKRQFREGEIEFDEYESQRDTLTQEREALTIARAKAEISQEMTAQTAEQQWRSTVNRFLDTAAKDGGLDYRKDAAKMGDLDLFVRTLAQRAEFADKPPEWFLQEADRRVRALHGIAAPAGGQATPRDPAAEAMARRTARASDAPRTLAQVPGSDGPGDVGSQFADLDSLDGNDLEAAIARMTPAQREKFARAQ